MEKGNISWIILDESVMSFLQEDGKGQKYYFLSWGKAGTMVDEEELKENMFDMDLFFSFF